jgi:hypothetical protein
MRLLSFLSSVPIFCKIVANLRRRFFEQFDVMLLKSVRFEKEISCGVGATHFLLTYFDSSALLKPLDKHRFHTKIFVLQF